MRWRRAASIFSYWTEGQFVVENYRTGMATSASPITSLVLHLFNDWRSLDEICRELPGYRPRSIRLSVHQLAAKGFLLKEGSRRAREDAEFAETWSAWLPHAAILHFGTKDMPFTNSEQAIVKRLRSYLKESPQPNFFQSSSKRLGRTVALPKVPSDNSAFIRILLKRRTHREFSAEPLDLERLSALLHYTWGVTGFINSWLLGLLPLKTSPSGGARHPGEAYVVAQRVRGLSPGLYHYAADRHLLERVATKITRRTATQYCAGQPWIKEAAAVVLMTAVLPRSIWKYRSARAYRSVLADAGHLCQTFCLVATYLGLAPFCTMALKDSMIERDLGIDGINEAVLYVAGVGLPAPGSSTSPDSFFS